MSHIENDSIVRQTLFFEFLKYLWPRPKLCEAMRAGTGSLRWDIVAKRP